MSKLNYQEIARREQLLNTLRDTAEKLREENPAIASLLYAAMLAVRTKKTHQLARQLREFSQSLVFPKESFAIQEERSKLAALLLKVENSAGE